MRVVDLTQPITPGMQVVPGDPEVAYDAALTLDTDGCVVHRLSLGTHTGTHLDAPAHWVENGAGVSQIPLEWLVSEAVVLRGRGEAGGVVELDDASEAWLLQAESGKVETLPTMTLICTGWNIYFGSADMLRNPGISGDIVRRLWALGVRVLGVDAPSPDRLYSQTGMELKDMPVHEYWLGHGGVIVENLTRLDHLPRRADVSILPLPLTGINGSEMDGAPVRAVARLEV